MPTIRNGVTEKPKVIRGLCLLLIVSGVAPARSSAQNTTPPSENVSSEQNKDLRDTLLQMQKQLAAQQKEIEQLQKQLNVYQPGNGSDEKKETPHSVTESAGGSSSAVGGAAVVVVGRPAVEKPAGEKDVSLASIKVGGAELTPGGFVDLENVYRTVNTQNNIATNYAAIPFNNTPQGHVSEFRTTAQYSRLSLKVTDTFGGRDVLGYVEGDFSGSDSPTVYQTVNPHTNRVRLYFGDLRSGKLEYLGGQTWSWLTPNRTGLGPMPSDLAITFNEDQNLGVGVAYTRAAEFRIAYHFNDSFAMGAGIENPDQYIGGFVALPSAFSTVLTSQFDNGSNAGAANLMPDIVTKAAYDTNISGKHFHVDIAGLMTSARESVIPVGQKTFSAHSVIGGVGQIGTSYDLSSRVRFLANTFWSDGGGRYLVGDGPQVVLRPNAAGTDVSPSMVHAGAGSASIEWLASEKTAFSIGFGADYFDRNFFRDTTNAAHPSAMIGYGGPGSPSTNNRTIQQSTVDWLETFWKHPRYGAMQFYTEAAYLNREPWSVLPGAPKGAHLVMIYAGFRYVLPSTSGTLLRLPYPN